MIKCILLVLLILVAMVLLKCTNFHLMIHFLNFVQLFYLQALLIIILPVSSAIFFHPQYLTITRAKILFLVSQIKNANVSRKFLVYYDVTSLFTNISLSETIDIGINLIFNHNPNLNITKRELKKHFLFATSQTHFFNSKFYNKIDGAAMGSPVAPVLANICM